MSAFVLVPGAGGSAWYWSRVVPLLQEAGHDAVAVDLPGDVENAGLPEYARLVEAAIGGRPDVVLVAQSLGGFTAPMVGARTGVAEIVLVNAMIPNRVRPLEHGGTTPAGKTHASVPPRPAVTAKSSM
ncbi:putative inactive methylesterase 20 [Arthrobacter sp. Hiyo8]|nr:putative inactive methylesterase 20 [Arthrobacter sp. Hiyo8]